MDEEDKELVLKLVWGYRNVETVSYDGRKLKVRYRKLFNGKITLEQSVSKEVGHMLVSLLNK